MRALECARERPCSDRSAVRRTVQRVLSAIYFRNAIVHRPTAPNSALPDHEQHDRSAVRRRGRQSSQRLHPSLRQQERRAADRRRRAAVASIRSTSRTSRASATSRRSSSSSARSGVDANGPARTRSTSTRRTSRPADLDPDALREDPRVDSARRAAARPLRQVTLPPPGGDVIGRRRLDTHFLALEQLGATFELDGKLSRCASTGFAGADVFLDEPSVTATENALVAAVAATGTTILRNAASEPHVQDLAHFLVALGAQIEGIGTNKITIDGGTPLGSAYAHASAPITSRSARSSDSPP